MKNYLLFHLYGAMAAWGNIAVGGVRPSHSYPTKSAIMGLLAAALGIKRDEGARLQALQNGLGFAVRLDLEGQLIVDYHTTQVPTRQALKNHPHYTRRDELLASDLATILSEREYYCDALYTIIIWEHDEQISLAELKDKIKQPVFTLYLGRKSCPISMPISPYLCEASTIEAALANYDNGPLANTFQEIFAVPLKKVQKKRLYLDTNGEMEKQSNYQQIEIRRDQLIDRSRWQYAEREEKLILLSAGKE